MSQSDDISRFVSCSDTFELDEPRFNGIDSDIIYGSINAFRYIFNTQNVDYEMIFNNLLVQYGGSFKNSSPEQLRDYYLHTLTKHSDFEDQFIVQSIQTAVLRHGKLHCLVDWVGFAPSRADDEANYLDLFTVPGRVLQAFINNSVNAADFLQLLRTRPEKYQRQFRRQFEAVLRRCPALHPLSETPPVVAPATYGAVPPLDAPFYEGLTGETSILKRIDDNFLLLRSQNQTFTAPIALLLENPAVRASMVDRALRAAARERGPE